VVGRDGRGAMSALRLEDGSAISLGAVIARAGEGVIYEVAAHGDWVAKIFHPELKDVAAKRAKVAAMIKSPPPGAVQADGFVVLTWPLHLIMDGHGVAGYVMSRVDTANAVEIHTVSNPANRASPLPSAPQWPRHVTWHHLVNVAANLCLAVESVHRVNAVIGDFQERNILVNDTTRVTLVDCDSMQFIDQQGHQFLCGVGRPEFTAPELAGANLATVARQKPSDLFSLAVHIHLLLMAGNHPFFRGEWSGGGDQPDALTLAQSGQWAGGPGSQLRTHPLAPPVDFLPPNIQRLFVRAFTDGARDPASRPSAAEWRQALQTVVITTCPRGHQVPAEVDRCPWCAIDDERATRRSKRPAAPAAAASQVTYQSASTQTPTPAAVRAPTAGRRTGLIAAGAVAAVVAVGAIGYAAFGGRDDGDESRISPSGTRSTMASSDSLPDDRVTTGPTSRQPSVGYGDLGLSTPMSRPACDGTGIVVLANLTTPGQYVDGVRRALAAHPGASYLRTDQSCPSLRQAMPNGDAIYAVYTIAGRTPDQLCSAVRAAGGDAYGKWLDTTSDPSTYISC